VTVYTLLIDEKVDPNEPIVLPSDDRASLAPPADVLLLRDDRGHRPYLLRLRLGVPAQPLSSRSRASLRAAATAGPRRVDVDSLDAVLDSQLLANLAPPRQAAARVPYEDVEDGEASGDDEPSEDGDASSEDVFSVVVNPDDPCGEDFWKEHGLTKTEIAAKLDTFFFDSSTQRLATYEPYPPKNKDTTH
jgi:hypothetical protein